MMNRVLVAVSVACAAVLVIAVPAPARETARGGDHLVAADDWHDEHGTLDALDENGPEGDHGSAGDDCAIGVPGPSVARELSRDHNGAPAADVDSGHARAPPASVYAPPTDSGA